MNKIIELSPSQCVHTDRDQYRWKWFILDCVEVSIVYRDTNAIGYCSSCISFSFCIGLGLCQCEHTIVQTKYMELRKNVKCNLVQKRNVFVLITDSTRRSTRQEYSNPATGAAACHSFSQRIHD